MLNFAIFMNFIEILTENFINIVTIDIWYFVVEKFKTYEALCINISRISIQQNIHFCHLFCRKKTKK